jgi:hypothetical protein
VQNFAHRMIDAPSAQHAAHHGHGAPHQRGGPGVGRSSPPGAGVHTAKPGKEKAHKPRHHGRHQGQPAKEPKPTHSPRAHSARPTSTPSPAPPAAKAHPSRSRGRLTR